MKAVIVGGGLAGTLAAKTLRELGQDVEIELFNEEKHPYYPRPNLIEYLAGRLPYERLFAFPEDWASRQRISVRSGQRIVRIRPDEKKVETASGETVAYDTLLLATGARSSAPAIRGSDKKGVFSLRTLDDAHAILDHLEGHDRVVVVGGGLLGLEIARALKTAGADVRVVEFFDRLLPRQLDHAAAGILKARIEKMGIGVRVGTVTEEILGRGGVEGLRFEGGDKIEAEMVILAAGVRPDIALAGEAGLAVNRGIIVDDRLRSSAPDIFAAGDSVEYKGFVYGIIPASFDQSRAAAYNMLDLDKPYEGTVPSTTLKVAGVYVTSVGIVNPEAGDHEVLMREDPEAGIYKKIVLKDGALAGAIWMGTKKWVAEIARLVAQNRNVASWKDSILDDEFDFYGI
jgi:nitrite reductase (NADH) large subunit